MARTIKTTLELGGETAYKKGLESVDRALKAMSKELSESTEKFAKNSASLKNVTSVGDAWKNSIDQQKIKVESLKGAVETSNKAYENAVKKYEDAAKANGENSIETLKAADAMYKAEKAADSYKTKLASAEKYLESSQDKMKKFTDENKNMLVLADSVGKVRDKISAFAENSPKLKAVSNAFEAVKGKAQGISEKLAPITSKLEKISTVTSTVKGAFELAGKKAKEIKEKLEPVINVCKNIAKAAAKITFKAAEVGAKAVSTAVNGAKKAFLAYGTAATGAALAIGTAAAKSYGELEQNLGGSEAVFGKYASTIQKTGEEAYKNLGVSQSDYLATANKMGALFQGSGVSQQQSLNLTEKAMQRAADMASVMGIDMQMALDSVAGAAKGNFTMMDNLGVAMNATNIEAYALSKGLDFTWKSATQAEKAEVAMQMFFENTEQYAGNFARESTETITGSLGMLKSAVSSLTAGLGNSEADIQNLSQNVVEAFGAVAENLMPIFENVANAFPKVVDTIVKESTKLIPQLATQISSKLPQVLKSFLSGFNAVFLNIVSSISTALPMIINNVLPVMICGFTNLITGLVTMLPELLPLIVDGFFALFIGLIDGLNQVIEELLPLLPEIVTRITESIIESLPILLEGALQLFLGLIEALGSVIEQLMPMLPQLISDLCDTLINNVDSIISAGFDLLIGLINGITNCIPTLLQKAPEVINKLVGSLTDSENLGKLITSGIDLIMALAEGLPKAIPDLLLAIPQIIVSIIGALMEQDWLQIGIDIIKGLGEGLIDGVDVIWEKIKSMAKELLNSIKSALGIHSPSKLFRDEVGTYLAQGIGVGFEDEMGNVTKQMQNAVPTSFDTVVSADINSISTSQKIPVIATGGNEMTVNYIFQNVTIQSDKDIEETAYKMEALRRKAQLSMGGI